MYYQYQTAEPVVNSSYHHMRPEELEEKVYALHEWKANATVQLENFRAACRLFNFCDVEKINELLNAKI